MTRPDDRYAKFIALGISLIGTTPTAKQIVELTAHAGAIVDYIATQALADATRGQILFGGPDPSDEVHDLLSSPLSGGIVDSLVWRMLESFIRARATDPANMDYARSWLAHWLRANG